MDEEYKKYQDEQAQRMYKIEQWLSIIEKHLNGIRQMMTFFVILTILAIIVQACNVFLNVGR